MTLRASMLVLVVLVGAVPSGAALAEDKPVVGLIPKAQKPITMNGKLDDWDGAFVTPVHVGHPDFANRGAQFLYLWDEKNLPEYLKGVCLTSALTYLTGVPIGRSRWGADLQPENKKLWKDWWAEEGKTFKVPAKKPNASWVPAYPILTEDWAARCREEFARGERRE